MKKTILGIILFFIFFGGCAHNKIQDKTQYQAKRTDFPVQDSAWQPLLQGDLNLALNYESTGDYSNAVIEYKKCLQFETDSAKKNQAQIGLARSLIKMGNYIEAVRILKPLSPEPQTVDECLRLALAGEALLRSEHFPEAETLLELSLTGIEDKGYHPEWIAVCFANLGSAYLKNDKPHQALVLYRKAAAEFENLKMTNKAKHAREMAGLIHDYIDNN